MADPFSRARAMMAAIAAFAVLPFAEREARLALLGPYRSHGKGRGTPMRRYGNSSGHMPHQGARETARRRRQIAAGILRKENGLAV